MVRLSSVVIEKAHLADLRRRSQDHVGALLHGMMDEQEVFEVKERLWRETGVTAKVSGW